MIKMSRNSQKLAILTLSIVMVLSLSVTTYANEPEQSQASEAVENDDKIQAILPTDAIGIFDFILDPQELIYKTNASAYDGQTFEEGATLFFKRSDGEVPEDYSSTSDAVTISNTGSVPIDVVITAGITVEGKDGFAMTDDKEFLEDTRPSLYLALTDGETEIPIMGEGEEAARMNITVSPASEGELEDNIYSFRLTGAANKEGDWSRMKNISFEVTVTWMVVAQEEESEEALLEEEPKLTDMQEKEIEPVEPGEEIVRKVVPVVSDSNVLPDDVKSEVLPTDEVSEQTDAPQKESSETEENSNYLEKTVPEEPATIKEPTEEEKETAP